MMVWKLRVRHWLLRLYEVANATDVSLADNLRFSFFRFHETSRARKKAFLDEMTSAHAQCSPSPASNYFKNQDEQLRHEQLWPAFGDGTVIRRRQLMQLSTEPILGISTGLVLNETMIKPKLLSKVTKPSLLSRTARCSSCSSPQVVGFSPERCDLIASQSTGNHVGPPQPQFKPRTAPQLSPKLTSWRFSTSYKCFKQR